MPPRYEFATVDADNVIVETVKRCEEDRAWIIRVYEYQQSRTARVTLRLGSPIRDAVECSLMEEGEEPVAWQGQEVYFPITPYEIKTFKVWL